MIDLVLQILKWLFITIAALLLIGLIYEQTFRWKLERKAFVGKTFVEINGSPIHYVKKGKGNCTVVFVSGMGSSHAIWQEVQNNLTANAVTLAYDRAGIMLSPNNGSKPTNLQVSEELKLLLEKTNCPKPYILVGHSMAGIYLRPFIKNYKNDIASIIFAEAAHPQQLKKASKELRAATAIPPQWFIRFAVDAGIYRTLFSFVPLSAEMPMEHPLHQVEKDFFYRTRAKVLQEVALDAQNFADAEKMGSFGNIPLTVITGTSPIRYSNIKNPAVRNEFVSLVNEVQEDLLHLSVNSRWVKAPNSGHVLQIKDSQLLTDEILKEINKRVND